jgi:hypothetical protein
MDVSAKRERFCGEVISIAGSLPGPVTAVRRGRMPLEIE